MRVVIAVKIRKQKAARNPENRRETVEVDSLSSQHRHQTQLLLSDFNQAKELLNGRISELEKQ